VRQHRLLLMAVIKSVVALGATGIAVTRCWPRRVSIAEPANPASHSGDLQVTRTRVRLLCEQGARYREAAKYDQAEPALCKGLQLAETNFGTNDEEVATVLNQIGMLDKYAGRFDDGERVLPTLAYNS
jgi:hypothetical protein